MRKRRPVKTANVVAMAGSTRRNAARGNSQGHRENRVGHRHDPLDVEDAGATSATTSFLLARMGRDDEAARAYLTALELEPPAAERRCIERRLAR